MKKLDITPLRVPPRARCLFGKSAARRIGVLRSMSLARAVAEQRRHDLVRAHSRTGTSDDRTGAALAFRTGLAQADFTGAVHRELHQTSWPDVQRVADEFGNRNLALGGYRAHDTTLGVSVEFVVAPVANQPSFPLGGHKV